MFGTAQSSGQFLCRLEVQYQDPFRSFELQVSKIGTICPFYCVLINRPPGPAGLFRGIGGFHLLLTFMLTTPHVTLLQQTGLRELQQTANQGSPGSKSCLHVAEETGQTEHMVMIWLPNAMLTLPRTNIETLSMQVLLPFSLMSTT